MRPGILFFLQVPADQAGSLVGRGRAAVRWRWQGHDQVATFEGLDLLLERKVLGVGDVGRGVVGAGVVGCHSVVAEPGLVGVVDWHNPDF